MLTIYFILIYYILNEGVHGLPLLAPTPLPPIPLLAPLRAPPTNPLPGQLHPLIRLPPSQSPPSLLQIQSPSNPKIHFLRAIIRGHGLRESERIDERFVGDGERRSWGWGVGQGESAGVVGDGGVGDLVWVGVGVLDGVGAGNRG